MADGLSQWLPLSHDQNPTSFYDTRKLTKLRNSIILRNMATDSNERQTIEFLIRKRQFCHISVNNLNTIVFKDINPDTTRICPLVNKQISWTTANIENTPLRVSCNHFHPLITQR